MTSSPLFWIVTIILIILATIFIVWLRHNFRVKTVKFSTGMVETELERNKEEETEAAKNAASINISGNTMAGQNKISVRREKTNVTNNKMVGENEIEVSARPQPQQSKGKRKK